MTKTEKKRIDRKVDEIDKILEKSRKRLAKKQKR